VRAVKARMLVVRAAIGAVMGRWCRGGLRGRNGRHAAVLSAWSHTPSAYHLPSSSF